MTAGGLQEFTGFRPAALGFLRALARHNDRGWFEANRARYESELREPLAALDRADIVVLRDNDIGLTERARRWMRAGLVGRSLCSGARRRGGTRRL